MSQTNKITRYGRKVCGFRRSSGFTTHIFDFTIEKRAADVRDNTNKYIRLSTLWMINLTRIFMVKYCVFIFVFCSLNYQYKLYF